jgi:hypothetical protein
MQCLYCGDEERVEVFEYWSSGEFLLDTCCEGMRDAAHEFLAEDPKAAAAWLETLGHGGDAEPVLQDLRRVIDNDGQLLLDHNLRIVPVSWAQAKAFVLEHHRHCPPPAGWRFGAGVMNGSQLIAVVLVGRPVARMLDPKKVLEVNRLCVRTDVAPGFVWNACSMLYGWAAREAKARGFERVVTYVMEHEAGVTLKAAGWKIDGEVKGRSWNAPSRPRQDRTAIVNKVRWTRETGLKRAPAPGEQLLLLAA